MISLVFYIFLPATAKRAATSGGGLLYV